jgi:type IV secretion system protein VirB4
VLLNIYVLFVVATQFLYVIAESIIVHDFIECCPQRIFLATDRAVEPQARAAYERFGLNERQVELIARAAPKRHYYLQSRRGNRLFELGLGPIALAFCGASDPASQRRIDSILESRGRDQFAKAWLEGCGLGWAAAVIDDFPTPISSKGDVQ